MKNTSFKRRWTKTSLKRIRAEYVKNIQYKGYFLCHTVPEFKELWKKFKSEIIANAVVFSGDARYVGNPTWSDCLFYGPLDSAEHRIKFLDYEIARLSKK